MPYHSSKATPGRYALDFETVSIPASTGKKLHGWYIPSGSTSKKPAIIVMHGWGGNATSLLTFAPVLHDSGLNILYLDASNHGKSDRNGHSNMLQFSQDINDGIDWLSQHPDVNPDMIFSMGHSNAASGSLLLASKRNIRGIIAISAFSHSKRFIKQWIKSNTHIPYWPIGWLVVQYMQLRLGCSYNDIAPINTINNISSPVLFVHGDKDELATIDDIQSVMDNANAAPVEILKVNNASHDSIRIFRTKACDRIINFIHQHTSDAPS